MVLHDVPLSQVLALTACHAWGQGLDVAGETYEDQELQAELGRIMAAKPLTTDE